MRVFYKIIFTVLLLPLAVSVCSGQSALTKMPFDIMVGVTKTADIESKGVCVAKAKGPDSLLHCTRLSMSDGKFNVYANTQEFVMKISFLSVSHHSLPDNWKALGLHLASSYRYRKVKPSGDTNTPTASTTTESESGNSQEEYIQIVTANGAQNITRKPTYASDYQKGELISFTIGKLRYNAEFIKWTSPKWCASCPTKIDYDNGLVSIEVIEEF